jgi:hypothetical protein
MWSQGVAIRPVPAHAVVESRTIDVVRAGFAEDDAASQRRLDEAFTRFASTQPALSQRLEDALERRGLDETARTLGYFLGVCVWLVFDRQFESRLSRVDETAVRAAHASLDLESELRANATDAPHNASALDADDVIAREQPALMAFVHEHVDVALDTASGRSIDVDDVYSIYRVVLVELLSLSHAVAPHPGTPARRAEVMA